MEKKLIKAIIDVIKDVKDRPSIYGVQFVGHEHISGSPVLYFTDGYVAIKLFYPYSIVFFLQKKCLLRLPPVITPSEFMNMYFAGLNRRHSRMESDSLYK